MGTDDGASLNHVEYISVTQITTIVQLSFKLSETVIPEHTCKVTCKPQESFRAYWRFET